MANSLWPQAVKSGLAADKPTTPDVADDTFVFYYETDTNLMKMWDGSAWISPPGVVASASVAATGSAQGDAAAILPGLTKVTAADGTKGVVLPAAVAGLVCYVKNSVAQILKVYPASGDAINALAGDAAISMAASTSAVFVAFDSTTWYTIPLLPS